MSTYNYLGISRDGITWIRESRELNYGFPDVDPEKMTESDRSLLSQYLRRNDGTLKSRDQRFSESVADEIDKLEPVTEEHVASIEYGGTTRTQMFLTWGDRRVSLQDLSDSEIDALDDELPRYPITVSDVRYYWNTWVETCTWKGWEP